MKDLSKIKVFLLFAAISLTSASCNKKNDVIPDVTINFTLNLNDPQFINLNAIGGAVTVNRNTNNWGFYAAGYAESGLIIARGVDEFFAYDRTCPYDYALNGSAVKVNIDPSGFAKAKCPQCGTVYELIANGTPASGIGRYPLKNYKTSFEGLYVRVWNNY